MTEWLSTLWAGMTSPQEAPQLWMILVAWPVAILAVYTPFWSISRNVVTVVHEGGHALTGLIWGRRIRGIRLHSDTSGVTISAGKPHGLGMIFTTAAGYTAPALLGLGLQWLSSAGFVILGLVLLSVAALFILLSIRNFFGLLVMIPVLAGFYFLSRLSVDLQTFSLLALATFLTVASLRPIIELQRLRWRGEAEATDADQLFRLTLIPAIAWVGYFLLVSLGSNLLTVWFQLQPIFSL